MKKFILTAFVFFVTGFSCSQEKDKAPADKNMARVGGFCEGCESIYESPIDFEKLNLVDTLPDYNEQGSKLEISGKVYKKDGITPAPGVVIYVYHTNQKGIYPKKGDETGWGKWHGYIRGWVKTGITGEYKFYTLKPGPYPNGGNPAHIHIIVKEPDINEYYIDDYVFEGEIYVDERYRKMVHDTGGSGIIKLEKTGDMLTGKRDIILGKNVEDYP